MSHIELACVECGASHEADMHALGCESCGSPLDVSYLDSRDVHDAFDDLDMPVPFHADSPTVTMGEGTHPAWYRSQLAVEESLRSTSAWSPSSSS